VQEYVLLATSSSVIKKMTHMDLDYEYVLGL
jgi:hypothetical protein